MKSSFLYVESNYDIKNILKKCDDITNIERVLSFEYGYVEGLADYILVDYELKNILVYPNDVLENNEIIIGLSSLYYLNNRNDLIGIIDTTARFVYLEDNLDFIINDVVDSGAYNKLYISESMFNDLVTNNQYIYVANIKYEDKVYDIVTSLRGQIDGKVSFLENLTQEDSEIRENINDWLKQIRFISYIMITIFIILLLVISKNVVVDIKDNMFLEKRLGYNNWQIKFNVFKRLISLHMLSIIVAHIIVLLLLIFGNFLLDKELSCFSANIFYIYIFILISDLLLSVVNNKSNN